MRALKASGKHRIQVFFRGQKYQKRKENSLWFQGTRIISLKKSGKINRFKGDRLESDEEYVGKSIRKFWERFKEHPKAPPQYMTTATPQVMTQQ